MARRGSDSHGNIGDYGADLIGLDHVQLAMPEGGERAARAFYGKMPDLREIPKPLGFVEGTPQLHWAYQL